MAGASKSTKGYWRDRVFTPKGTSLYYAKFSADKKQKLVPLKTTIKKEAAERAAEFWSKANDGGWEAIGMGDKVKIEQRTFGGLIDLVVRERGLKPTTAQNYSQAILSIVASIKAFKGRDRLDRARAEDLCVLTTEGIQRWSREYLAERDGSKQARSSRDAMLRAAKSLLSPKPLKKLGVTLPCSDLFDEVHIGTQKFNKHNEMGEGWWKDLEARAIKELGKEELKVFTLAIQAGLRRGEIDRLKWNDLQRKDGRSYVLVRDGKSEGSEQSVQVNTKVLDLLESLETCPVYVIKGTSKIPYRAHRVFLSLIGWLKTNGVPQRTALHFLRKEAISRVNDKFGPHVASYWAGHEDMRTTVRSYLRKSPKEVVLGYDVFAEKSREQQEEEERKEWERDWGE